MFLSHTRDELKNPESIMLYNVLNGLMRLRNVDIYVTGSNSKMLYKRCIDRLPWQR